MRKLSRFLRVSQDILKQSENGFVTKTSFFASVTLHYLLKSMGFNYVNIPRLKVTVEDCIFETRRNTLDFWMVWKDYEKEVFKQLYSEINRGDTFIDVGANIGRYSVLLANKRLYVYSFEPIKSNFDLLEQNININNLNNNVKTNNFGLGNEKKSANISYFPHKHGEASLILEGGKKEKIDIDKLDNLKIIPKGDCFLKIDVEGYELEVLLGAEKFIHKNRPKIIIEIWNKKTKELLKDWNYFKKGEIWYPKNGKTD